MNSAMGWPMGQAARQGGVLSCISGVKRRHVPVLFQVISSMVKGITGNCLTDSIFFFSISVAPGS